MIEGGSCVSGWCYYLHYVACFHLSYFLLFNRFIFRHFPLSRFPSVLQRRSRVLWNDHMLLIITPCCILMRCFQAKPPPRFFIEKGCRGTRYTVNELWWLQCSSLSALSLLPSLSYFRVFLSILLGSSVYITLNSASHELVLCFYDLWAITIHCADVCVYVCV